MLYVTAILDMRDLIFVDFFYNEKRASGLGALFFL